MDQEENSTAPWECDADHQPSRRSSRAGYANARYVISPEILSALQQEYTGLLWVPKPVRAAEERAQDVLRLKNKGLSTARIAELVGVTPRRVRQIVAKARHEGTLKEERWY